MGSEALADYVKGLESGGAKEGWGKIRRLVYIAAFVLPEGGSLMAALGFKALPWFIIDVSLCSNFGLEGCRRILLKTGLM